MKIQNLKIIRSLYLFLDDLQNYENEVKVKHSVILNHLDYSWHSDSAYADEIREFVKSNILSSFDSNLEYKIQDIKLSLLDVLYEDKIISENLKKKYGLFSILLPLLKNKSISFDDVTITFDNLTYDEAGRFGLIQEFCEFDSKRRYGGKSFDELKEEIQIALDLMVEDKLISVEDIGGKKYYETI